MAWQAPPSTGRSCLQTPSSQSPLLGPQELIAPSPPGTTPHPFAPLTLEEIQTALASVSPTSALGPSGVTWPMVKHIVQIAPQEMVRLLQACLDLGHHPSPWRTARVVMLKKPNKKDPSAPRSYRPITLEECLGKLLEKIVTK